MVTQLRPLSSQVMVITGASSGIGLATALAAAKEDVSLVLAARSEDTLGAVVQRIHADGGEAIAVQCDVTDPAQVNQLAVSAIKRFGRIDTWVNNAGLGMYGRLDEVSLGDARQLFETNFWGVVYGSLAALPRLRDRGGAIINVGSEVSEAFAPLIGFYTASKHAVKRFTDSLRVEIEKVDEAPISITLIQPTAVDTPFPEHSRNFMDKEPKLPDSMIQPEVVADAILKAAVSPTRSKKVGTKATVDTLMAKLLPGWTDLLSSQLANQQQYDEPPRNAEGILWKSSEACETAGRTHGAGGKRI